MTLLDAYLYPKRLFLSSPLWLLPPIAECIGEKEAEGKKSNQNMKEKEKKKQSHCLMYNPRGKNTLFLEIIHFVGKGRGEGEFGGISFKTGMERRKWVYEAIFIAFVLSYLMEDML